MRQKDIKNTKAINITNWSDKEVYQLLEVEKGLDTVATSMGIYGVNGALIQGRKTGTLYKVVSRSGNLFIIL